LVNCHSDSQKVKGRSPEETARKKPGAGFGKHLLRVSDVSEMLVLLSGSADGETERPISIQGQPSKEITREED